MPAGSYSNLEADFKFELLRFHVPNAWIWKSFSELRPGQSAERGGGATGSARSTNNIFSIDMALRRLLSETNPADAWDKHFQDVSGLHFLMVMVSLMDTWSKASWYWKHSICCCVRMWEIIQSASRVWLIYFSILSHFKKEASTDDGHMVEWSWFWVMMSRHSVTLEFEKGSGRASRVLLFIYLFISLCFTLKGDHTFFFFFPPFLELQFPTRDVKIKLPDFENTPSSR